MKRGIGFAALLIAAQAWGDSAVIGPVDSVLAACTEKSTRPGERAFTCPVTEKVHPCVIEDTPSQCHELEIARSDGRKLDATAVLATVRGTRVWIQCNVTTKKGDALPPPCSAIIH